MRENRLVAGVLDIAWRQYGADDGWPCILSHGFPYDVHAYADVAPLLATAGARVIVPYLRGYGPTRFVSEDTPRSGEQAALAADLKALMDALRIHRATLAGYDWGGRAGCIVAALWPERVEALVSGNSYNIQNIAQAFDNPDFVDVVIHSYRHRYGLAAGDPAYAGIEARLVAQPSIAVPAISIDGDADGVNFGTAHHRTKFAGPHEHRVFHAAGHNLPQERPAEWARAVLDARTFAQA